MTPVHRGLIDLVVYLWQLGAGAVAWSEDDRCCYLAISPGTIVEVARGDLGVPPQRLAAAIARELPQCPAPRNLAEFPYVPVRTLRWWRFLAWCYREGILNEWHSSGRHTTENLGDTLRTDPSRGEVTCCS